MTRQDLQTLVVTEARRLGLDPPLALALAEQESGFDPAAKSPTGVVGLFQVTNKTGAAYGQTPETRTDPQVSTHAGLTYFRDLLQEVGGHVETALTHYNGGSDPHFAAHVLRHKPAYELAQRLYGEQHPDVPAAPSLAEALYGPQPLRPPTGSDAPARGEAPRQPPTLAEVLYGSGPAAPTWETGPMPPVRPGGPRIEMAVDKASRPDVPAAPSLAEVLYGSQPQGERP